VRDTAGDGERRAIGSKFNWAVSTKCYGEKFKPVPTVYSALITTCLSASRGRFETETSGFAGVSEHIHRALLDAYFFPHRLHS